jgi:hypothetical protein
VKNLWFEKFPEQFESLRGLLERQYPSLIPQIIGGKVTIRGTFSVRSEGERIDEFEIEICLPDDFPDGMPKVREVLGRIPREADRHVNTSDGTLCMFVEDEREWVFPSGSSFDDFLEGPLRSHLIYQLCVETGAKWEHGQRSHGTAGVIEFYQEKFGVKSKRSLLGLLNEIRAAKPRWHARCPCGGRRTLWDCHGKTVRLLRAKIPTQRAKDAFTEIASLK